MRFPLLVGRESCEQKLAGKLLLYRMASEICHPKAFKSRNQILLLKLEAAGEDILDVSGGYFWQQP
jgi:hypothetical protein